MGARMDAPMNARMDLRISQRAGLFEWARAKRARASTRDERCPKYLYTFSQDIIISVER